MVSTDFTSADHVTSRPIGLLPQALASFGAAVAGDWLYIIGGHVGKTHEHSRDNLSSGFFRWNLLDRSTWEQLPGGAALQSVALVEYNGLLYRVGGLSARNARGEPEDLHSVAEFARFDPVTRQWEDLPPMPQPRSSHDAIVSGDTLYVMGGWILSGDAKAGTWCESACAVDLSATELKWEPVADIPTGRRALALAAAAGRVYALGGMDSDNSPTTRVEIFDTASGEWSNGPKFPTMAFGVAAVGLDDAVYASGRDSRLYRLKTDGDDWEPIASHAFGRMFHRLVAASPVELLAIGGACYDGHNRHIESVQLAGEARAPRCATWVIPTRAAAKNRQGVFLNGSSLFAFGGNNSLEQHDFEPENFVNEGYRINLCDLGIRRVADLPVRRQTMTTFVDEEEKPLGYAIGGFGHDGQVARSHTDLMSYDFKNDEWKTLPQKLPSPRTQFGSAVHDGYLWIFGGLDYDPRRDEKDRFRHLRDVIKWNMNAADGAFEPADITLPSPRRAFGGALLGGKFYLVGGMKEGFERVETCDVFDFESSAWESIPSPARSRISPEMVALNGKLYLAGGSSPTEAGSLAPEQSIEVFDPAEQAWSTLVETMPIPAKHIQMFVFGDSLLVYTAHEEGTNAVRLLWVDVADSED